MAWVTVTVQVEQDVKTAESRRHLWPVCGESAHGCRKRKEVGAMGKLTTTLDRVGNITKRPPIWAVIAVVLAAAGGQKGQRAACGAVSAMRSLG